MNPGELWSRLARRCLMAAFVVTRIRPVAATGARLWRNHDAHALLLSRKRPRIILNRSNALTVASALVFERRGVLTIEGVAGDQVVISFFGEPGKPVRLDVMRQLMALLGSDKGAVVAADATGVSLCVKRFGITLRGPVDVVVWAMNELVSELYDHMPDVRGRVVVDVGAYLGDTALYFASRGARVVYAYEPSPQLAALARVNVSSSRNIVFHDFGLACGSREACLEEGRCVEGAAEARGPRVRLEDVNAALSEVMRREGAIDLLKVDCEGGEHEIMACLAESLLRRMRAIVIEIHGGDHAAILGRLRGNGFRVVYTGPFRARNESAVYVLENSDGAQPA